jgi:hypothetical protein
MKYIMVSVYKALNLSYQDMDKQRKSMKEDGYNYDSMMSNNNEQVYYNPSSNKLLMSIAGTHNISDWGTDLYLAAGHLKDTSRYKEAERTLHDAKTKYKVGEAAIVGHSLGASIGSGVASSKDHFTGLNAGYTIGQKTRSNHGNHNQYRNEGDLVSILGANATHMHTLKNPNIKTGVIPLDILRAHNVRNIKNSNLKI